MKSSGVDWNDQAHFYAVAANLMRSLLVDEPRKMIFRTRWRVQLSSCAER